MKHILVLFLSLSISAYSAVPPKDLPTDPIEISKYHIANWKSGMDTKEIGKPLRGLIVESNSMDEMIEAMTLLQEMQVKLRSEYSDVFPNLDTGEAKLQESDDFMDNLRTTSAGLNYSHQGDTDKAIDVLIREAWLMSRTAITQLKTVFFNNVEGWPESDERIQNFFQEYAGEGIPRGQYLYGKHLLWNTENSEKAIEYLTESAIPEAHMEGFWWFAEEKGELDKSVDFARSAAELGDVTGLYELGIYAQEEGKYKLMSEYFISALESDPDFLPAQLELARAYVHGAGVEENEEKGAEMMSRLTDSPEDEIRAIACVNMAVFYARGVGVETSKIKSQEYLDKAEELGYDVPQRVLDSIEFQK